MKRLLLDTDVLVDYLRGYKEAIQYVKAHSEEVLLSVIVVAEVYAGIRDEDEQKKLDEFVGLFRLIPVTLEIAKTGGLYRRDFLKSYGVSLADGLIAATAKVHDAELITLN